jgi:aquaporin Z
MRKPLSAEFLATFWLILGGCGSAVLAAAKLTPGIRFAGVALSFGLPVLTMAFSLGHVAGARLHRAVNSVLLLADAFQRKKSSPI